MVNEEAMLLYRCIYLLRQPLLPQPLPPQPLSPPPLPPLPLPLLLCICFLLSSLTLLCYMSTFLVIKL